MLQDLSTRRPIHSGVVLQVTGAGVVVQLQVSVQMLSALFPLGEVFFFRSDGLISNGAVAPGALHPGDRVLVPEPDRGARLR